ncbi:LOW QUALITY PROTEIN: melanotransferrin-like [Haliotis rubra]|uniref:LOW QUALITY PROTEIN: melanotransferrin-like n=1 Tax=Haliotis rubra TaxID=36100 RepID=UPI001EE5693B|nr:LOW QUALITY PROTEIN: melanotransferrin-like [Haliotis rubra]
MHWNLKVLVLAFLTTALADRHLVAGDRATRWCVVSDDEEAKCLELQKVLETFRYDASVVGREVIPSTFTCVRSVDVFECMKKIENDQADLMTLDSGQGYYSGRYHNMMPILAENYEDVVKDKPNYYAVAVFRQDRPVDLNALRKKNICFPGIGTSAGYLYPIAELLDRNLIPVEECNAVVKSVTSFFNRMCLPGALTSFYNPFGNNPTSVCESCNGAGEERCTTSDPSAGFDGAYNCMASGRGDLTFLRHDTVEMMTSLEGSQFTPDTFRLLCPDNTKRPVTDFAECNWGVIPSHIIMTSAVREQEVVNSFKRFILQAVDWFKVGGTYYDKFQIFESKKSYDAKDGLYLRKNLMFSDTTKRIEDIDASYYEWVGPEFNDVLNKMQRCPLDIARWCVISIAEKIKCESMIMAFKAKDLKPEIDCLLGTNTTQCMDMIAKGDADLMNLDAGDIYIAGRRFNLIPIAAEDYGDMSMSFKVVAAARKTDKITTLFNMKGKRACQPGIGRGDGWIIPLNIYIETEQFIPSDCTMFENIGQLFVRSCIPGALDKEYNPKQTPISLCEGCAGGGYRKCQRNSEEQYYGASGAFRCLVERGGDVSFVRHLTVRDNTDGRNHAKWARNRRSDDYELLCKDGRRVNIDKFSECHLGVVPANAIVTSKFKSAQEREIFWNLVNYGQQFFSSDIDGDFHMFDSGTWYSDLMFTDAAVRLMRIPDNRQNYLDWLGEDFVAQIENLQKYTCVNPSRAFSVSPSFLFVAALVAVVQFFKL